MAKHLRSHHDQMDGRQTYELADGRRVQLDARLIEQHGVEWILHQMGLGEDPALMLRRPVFWEGQMIGTVPHSFHPHNARSWSFFYDPRPADFVEEGNGWRASGSLGPGDIAAIAGFKPA